MNNGLSKPLGTVLLAAAVFAAAGCTAPESPSPLSSTAGNPAPSAPAADPSVAGPKGSSAPVPAAGAAKQAAPAAPATPSGAAQAAPAPTFAPAEQRYLASRVPKGTDPNAVLQVGQERCAQLEAVKAADPKAVVSHLIENRGSEEAGVIAELCPGLKPELTAAGHGFPDGDFNVGAPAPDNNGGSIAAGRYEAWNPSPGCMLTVYDAAGKAVGESNGSAVTIPAGAARVVSDGCYTWLAA